MLSSHIEVFEEEDPQQGQQIADVTDVDVQDILFTIADRLAAEEPPEVTDYIRATLSESSPAPTYMDHTTAIRIGRWLSLVIAEAADDRDGLRHAIDRGR